jgi:predicted dehydrogenase
VLEDTNVELIIVGVLIILTLSLLDLSNPGTPSPTHYEIAKAALEAGKHGTYESTLTYQLRPDFSLVLVDKPVTSTAAQARELGDLAKAKGLILYAFQNRRFDSDYLSLKKLLSLPESSPQSIGDVVEFETQLVQHFLKFAF